MSLDGNGTYSPPAPQFPAIPNTIIYADDFNQIILDIATALSTAIFRDGQAAFTADQSMGGHKLTNLANGVNPQDAATVLQVFTDPVFLATTVAGFKITGSMFQALMTTINLVASGTLTLSGDTVNLTGTTLLDLSGSGEVALPANSHGVTAAAGDNSTLFATTAFCVQLAFQAALPAQPETSAPLFLQTLNGIASWAVSGIGSVATTTSATSITLTAASAGYQSVAMTAMGKHVSLPDATTMTVGGPRFILKNDGGYPFGIRDASGVLVMAVAAGGIAYATLKDAGSAAGSWSVIGDNLEPGLITIDNTFSSTYASTVLKPFVALDDNKSIHFLALAATGVAAVCVDNTTGAVGTPVVLGFGASSMATAFKVSSTSFIVFDTAGQCIVGSISGTSITLGTLTAGASSAAFGSEDFSGAPKIAQLTSTLYLASYTSGTNTSVVAISVSGTTVTIGTAANIITASSVANSTTTYRLTDTTALVIYLSGSTGPYTVNSVVISVSGTTCTVNTPSGNGTTSAAAPVFSCQMTANKFMVAYDNNNTLVNVRTVEITGVSVSNNSFLTVEAANMGAVSYTANSATRYNPHLFPLDSSRALLWYFDSSGVSRAVVLTESGGLVAKGSILYGSISRSSDQFENFGVVAEQGNAEFVAIKQAGHSGAFIHYPLPHKISASTITAGSIGAFNAMPVSADARYAKCVRLSGGCYVIAAYSGGGACRGVRVFRSNGDFIEDRGQINTFSMRVGGANHVPAKVSPSRLVLLATNWDGSTVSSSTDQLRLLSVEIAK